MELWYKYDLSYCTHLLSAFEATTFEMLSLMLKIPELTEQILSTLQQIWQYYDSLLRVTVDAVDTIDLISTRYKNRFKNKLSQLWDVRSEIVRRAYYQIFSECFHFLNLMQERFLPFTTETSLQIARHMRFSSIFLGGDPRAPERSDTTRLRKVLFADALFADSDRM